MSGLAAFAFARGLSAPARRSPPEDHQAERQRSAKDAQEAAVLPLQPAKRPDVFDDRLRPVQGVVPPDVRASLHEHQDRGRDAQRRRLQASEGRRVRVPELHTWRCTCWQEVCPRADFDAADAGAYRRLDAIAGAAANIELGSGRAVDVSRIDVAHIDSGCKHGFTSNGYGGGQGMLRTCLDEPSQDQCAANQRRAPATCTAEVSRLC